MSATRHTQTFCENQNLIQQNYFNWGGMNRIWVGPETVSRRPWSVKDGVRKLYGKRTEYDRISRMGIDQRIRKLSNQCSILKEDKISQDWTGRYFLRGKICMVIIGEVVLEMIGFAGDELVLLTGDLMPRESIVVDGSGVNLEIR
uniref:Uncharacterized protein n=1 Tax=Oryza sativa subsp. japonica TaxID=39947 RepID=Q2QWG3_ORYSJ|nr:hypothetical protein LOC_Os12g09440 [Oryza sativa Japonica Group]